ncbi:MAG: GerMN domain-containing protein [Candidatus Gracilibacteria bacterium]|jgi:hypothetical protein
MKKYLLIAGLLLLSACQSEEIDETPIEDPITEEPAVEEPIVLTYIKLEDDGATGMPVGCGDSSIAVEMDPQPILTLEGEEKVEWVLEELFSNEDWEETGLYNALDESALTVDSVSIEGDILTVALSGELLLGGTCDDPRAHAQITKTIEANSGDLDYSTLLVTLNGQDLSIYLSGKGE